MKKIFIIICITLILSLTFIPIFAFSAEDTTQNISGVYVLRFFDDNFYNFSSIVSDSNYSESNVTGSMSLIGDYLYSPTNPASGSYFTLRFGSILPGIIIYKYYLAYHPDFIENHFTHVFEFFNEYLYDNSNLIASYNRSVQGYSGISLSFTNYVDYERSLISYAANDEIGVIFSIDFSQFLISYCNDLISYGLGSTYPKIDNSFVVGTNNFVNVFSNYDSYKYLIYTISYPITGISPVPITLQFSNIYVSDSSFSINDIFTFVKEGIFNWIPSQISTVVVNFIIGCAPVVLALFFRKFFSVLSFF